MINNTLQMWLPRSASDEPCCLQPPWGDPLPSTAAATRFRNSSSGTVFGACNSGFECPLLVTNLHCLFQQQKQGAPSLELMIDKTVFY